MGHPVSDSGCPDRRQKPNTDQSRPFGRKGFYRAAGIHGDASVATAPASMNSRSRASSRASFASTDCRCASSLINLSSQFKSRRASLMIARASPGPAGRSSSVDGTRLMADVQAAVGRVAKYASKSARRILRQRRERRMTFRWPRLASNSTKRLETPRYSAAC